MPRPIQVSPRHHVALADDYLRMIDVAPREDFVVRNLARRKAGEMTLMMGDLVIAGAATRERYALARTYPLHFRKTYYPGKMHGDPGMEFELHQRASELVDVPPPIGSTPNSFRSCFLPGTPLDRLSTFGTAPDESNVGLDGMQAKQAKGHAQDRAQRSRFGGDRGGAPSVDQAFGCCLPWMLGGDHHRRGCSSPRTP